MLQPKKNVPANRPRSSANRNRRTCRDENLTAECSLPPNAGVKPPRIGVATACSVAQSTLLTPRCGVGLNDLLGGPDAGEGKAVANLPKAEARMPRRAPRTHSQSYPKPWIRRGRTIRCRSQLPKPANATHATCERALHSNRRRNGPENRPKSMPTEADKLQR